MRSAILVFLGVALALIALSASAAAPRGYKVIVNPQNPTRNVQRRFLAEAFLKKVSQWPDGEVIHPVDLAPDSLVRAAFVAEVIERPASAVRNYWQQLIFSGRGVPPPELESDEAVIRYVARHRGAVGYVSVKAEVVDTKVVAVE